MANQIWLEKYRPTQLSEICGNPQTVSSLQQILTNQNLPNLILAGPPGIGKTSSILILARSLLQQQFKECSLELNASDDRGIDVIRETVKTFAQKKVNLPINRHKIIILDEADSLTEGAQQALRMIISDYSSSTRFVLSCNDSSRIIEPIQSRCAILRFSKVDDQQVQYRIRQIIEKEQMQFDDQAVQLMGWICDGDMRQAINNLQAVYNGYGILTVENVHKICDIPNIEQLQNIIDLAVQGSFDQSAVQFKQLWNEGYLAIDLVKLIGKIVMNENTKYRNIDQNRILEQLSRLKMRVLSGLDSQIQFMAFFASISQFG